MAKLFRSRSGKKGAPPGTPMFLGEKRTDSVTITVLDYDEATFTEKRCDTVDESLPLIDKKTVTWINVDGLHDPVVVEPLAACVNLHPLVQEDILNTTQRAKYEDHDNYLYIVLRMLQWDAERDEVVPEQVSLIVGANYVISFQELAGDVFEPIRALIRSSKSRIRKMPASYLAYRLIDAIVDGYFAVLERLGDQIEAIEATLVSRPTPESLHGIYRLKRESLLLRRSIWPLREVISGLERAESELIGEETHLYFRDVNDHCVQVLDTIETFRDLLAGMLDTYLSSISNRMNEIMKVLTLIATIFIPLTFVAGIYGMNFKYMPELERRWAYPAALGVMAVVAGAMLLYFRRKRWL